MQNHGLRRLRYKLRPYILQFKQKLPLLKPHLYLKQQYVEFIITYDYKAKASFKKDFTVFLREKRLYLANLVFVYK